MWIITGYNMNLCRIGIHRWKTSWEHVFDMLDNQIDVEGVIYCKVCENCGKCIHVAHGVFPRFVLSKYYGPARLVVVGKQVMLAGQYGHELDIAGRLQDYFKETLDA